MCELNFLFPQVDQMQRISLEIHYNQFCLINMPALESQWTKEAPSLVLGIFLTTDNHTKSSNYATFRYLKLIIQRFRASDQMYGWIPFWNNSIITHHIIFWFITFIYIRFTIHTLDPIMNHGSCFIQSLKWYWYQMRTIEKCWSNKSQSP